MVLIQLANIFRECQVYLRYLRLARWGNTDENTVLRSLQQLTV